MVTLLKLILGILFGSVRATLPLNLLPLLPNCFVTQILRPCTDGETDIYKSAKSSTSEAHTAKTGVWTMIEYLLATHCINSHTPPILHLANYPSLLRTCLAIRSVGLISNLKSRRTEIEVSLVTVEPSGPSLEYPRISFRYP